MQLIFEMHLFRNFVIFNSCILVLQGVLLSSVLLFSNDAISEPKAKADGPCIQNGIRYVDCGNGTITDTETGLIWLKDANCAIFGLKSWADTISAVAELADGQCGLSDGSTPGEWHLPFQTDWGKTVAKAKEKDCFNPTLTNKTGELCFGEDPSPFINVQNGFYWTASVLPVAPGTAWALGNLDISDYNYRDHAFGWPVRGNDSGINNESCKNKGWQKLGFRNQGQCNNAVQ